MAQVTVCLTSKQEEELGGLEDLSESDTVVERLLEEQEDGRTGENWRKLVRKLSNKRRRKERSAGGEEEEEEDNIPADWRPDFIPREEAHQETAHAQQPDLVVGTTSGLVRGRSEHRRYLQREMGRMKSNSVAAETVQEEENEEREGSFTLEQPYKGPRLTM